jgi:dipeptidase D
MAEIVNLEPKLLWKHFDELRKIPRCSGHEEAAGKYVVAVAKRLGLAYEQDATGNVVIRKPGSKGHESAKPVVLQGHLDMVCEKNSSKAFDFSKDAIGLVLDGDWLRADGTTLGSDNGIGVATALAILEDNSLAHGPVEALFTVDEERGLTGAKTLSPNALKGRALINLDSEELGVFSIGCAGGEDSTLTLPLKRQKAKGDKLLSLHFSGLRGGHSGIDIHEGRGNAIKILNRLIWQLNKEVPLELVSLNGGDKHNAIPREAVAQVVVSSTKVNAAREWLTKTIKDIQVEFSPVEKNIKLEVNEVKDVVPQVLEKDSHSTLSALLFALPHGPLAMSRAIKDLVETSNNVASIKTDTGKVTIVCSSRSSNSAALKATCDKLMAIAQLAGAAIEQPGGYPGWMPNLDSKILKICSDTFKQVSGKEAKYMAIHAGLECGLIGEKYPGMDMISIGPTIRHPHSPEECVHVGSVKEFYMHVLKVLEVLG